MNRILRFCVCRRSLLRRNPPTSEAISSSLISNNHPTCSSNLTTLISKFHHIFNFSIPGNQSRNFSEEPECNFGYDYVDNEISELYRAIDNARDDIETRTLPPPDAIKIMADRFHASKQKFGLDIEKKRCIFRLTCGNLHQNRSLKTYFDDVVDFGEYFVKSGGRSFTEYEDWCYPLTYGEGRIAKYMVDEDAASAVTAENLADNTNQQEALHCLESSQSVEVSR